ncbi:hypothetical protein R3P38DRAFT_2819922 [Favolaschia claudopus]|uniref:Uncharacterized protein n=1 Tax=Favolaschia claudopus TaxID=2862362 RepID=A0AAW0EFH8_9AGAR
MEARSRRLFLASAGFLFASIGFTLVSSSASAYAGMKSVLSTLLRLFYPLHAGHGDAVAATIRRRRTLRNSIHSESRRQSRCVETPSDSTISTTPSSSTSTHTSSSSLSTPRRDSAHEPARKNSHDERPDFRNTPGRRQRRSDSAPPSPAFWATSHLDANVSTTHTSVDDSVLKTLHSRHPSINFHLPHPSSLDGILHRRKSRKATSVSSVTTAETNEPVAEKRRSQLFALHKRASLHADDTETSSWRWSRHSASVSMVEQEGVTVSDGRPSHESRHSQDIGRAIPKRSQTLRTQPYAAPYFFPTPGSVEAESYLPPRQAVKPVRSKTLASDELGVLQ